MLRLVFLLFLTAGCYYFGYAQPDSKSSGRCLSFDGVDDYLDLGNILDDLKLPLTVEAWVYVDGAPAYALPVFSSQDNLPLYNGVDFAVTSTRITGGYGDGRGENSSDFRRAKSADIASIANKWTHVAIVIKGPLDMQLYVNGIDAGGHYDGYTDLPINSNSPGDVAKVGQWSPNGSKYFFKGKMDEVRVWNIGLTANQIRTNMCQKLKGNETGLVANWSFNETSGTAIEDRSPRNHAAGKMMGNPTRTYSGAPLGDNSTFLYGSSWTATSSLASLQGNESLLVNTITGNPEGIHIYYVGELPSQTGNLPSTTPPAYFGVFAGGVTSAAYNYRATYSFKNSAPCALARRRDNSVAAWTLATGAVTTSSTPIEIIRTGVPNSTVSLGADKTTCTTSPVALGVTGADASATYLWNTGQTSASINVSATGKYWVAVTDACGTARDTLQVSFLTIPTAALGADRVSCNTSVVLKPVANAAGLTFQWQDGSTASQLEARASGSYWVNVRNACGVDRDTIELTFPGTPAASLGLDRTLCDISTRLTPVADPTNLTFQWQDGSTAPQLDAYGTGVYWVRVSNACTTVTDSVDLKFLTAPMGVSLGEDKALCNVATVLTPVSDPDGLTFEWQDGSTKPQLEANAPGIYWVLVSNACGLAYDTMAITPKMYSIPLPPNVITPNGDDKNEAFILPVDAEAGAVRLAIYNRWGQRVYRSDDYKNTWTGSGLAAGVYYYQAGGGCIEGIKGVINILR
jgi:hypothetical protein